MNPGPDLVWLEDMPAHGAAEIVTITQVPFR